MSTSADPAEPSVARSVADLRSKVGAWRKAGLRVALVPTMGALHEGHLSLLRQALDRADRAVISIFVNPTQFAPGEDLAAYPRTFAADLAAIAGVDGGTLVYAPDAAAMYPPGFGARIEIEGPAKVGLEDRFRPTHFAGVATVVAKLFLQAQADIALFGEKDYQQLKVVQRMARDLDIPVEVIGCPTIRERDGLAMSSRNRFLPPGERLRAALVHGALRKAADGIAAGEEPRRAVGQAAAELTREGFGVDYLEARNADTLLPLTGEADEPIRLLAAARLGAVRLIDNIGMNGG